MIMKPLISVVICTFNRATLLQLAIESIIEQKFPANKYELLIIDNCSTDETNSVVKEVSAHNNQIHYYFEENQGLSFARNRGWREARGEYIGFLDDDAKAAPDWINTAQRIIETTHPAAFGGPYFPYYQSKKPCWFMDKYGSWTQGGIERGINEVEYLVGGNLFIRRNLLEMYSGFDESFGMIGNQIRYGEETALLEKIRHQETDNCLYYVPDLQIYHLVRPEKMTWEWIIQNKYADGRDYYNLFPNRKKPVGFFQLIFKTIRFSILLILDVMVRVFLRDRKKYPCFQNYYYEHTMKYVAAFGEIVEQYKEKYAYDKK